MKPGGTKTRRTRPKSAAEEASTTARIPTSESLLKTLLGKRWSYLHTEYSAAQEGKYPGVYVLAYADRELKNEPIEVKDIFYVGMSHAGVVKRLKQFVKGLDENKYHSAARRFFRTKANGVPFSQLEPKKTFYFASVSVPCIVQKELRTPADLRKMGEVAKCEYVVLAHVKERLGQEPKLNLK